MPLDIKYKNFATIQVHLAPSFILQLLNIIENYMSYPHMYASHYVIIFALYSYILNKLRNYIYPYINYFLCSSFLPEELKFKLLLLPSHLQKFLSISCSTGLMVTSPLNFLLSEDIISSSFFKNIFTKYRFQS